MKRWHFITESKYILNLQLSRTGRTSLLKTFWSKLKFPRTFNNNIFGVINGKGQVTISQNSSCALVRFSNHAYDFTPNCTPFSSITITRRLAACTQAVAILRGTTHIAIELNVLHLKSYEIQLNRYMCAQVILPLIAFLGIDL